VSEFTPGPWFFRKKNGDTDSWWVTAAPPRPGHRGFVAEAVARQEQNEANARLIAAAPDLYEALKDLRAMIIGEHGASAYENVNGEHADAALAKADGR
jgi:hypothetical protein